MSHLERLPTESTVLDITTGEVVSLADTPQLAVWKRNLDSLRRDLVTAERIVDAAILAAMDQSALWTYHAGGVTLTGQAPGDEASWDAEELWIRLDELVQAGRLVSEARDAAVRVTTKYEAMARGIAAVRKVPGVADVIDDLCTRVPRAYRRVRVKG